MNIGKLSKLLGVFILLFGSITSTLASTSLQDTEFSATPHLSNVASSIYDDEFNYL